MNTPPNICIGLSRSPANRYPKIAANTGSVVSTTAALTEEILRWTKAFSVNANAEVKTPVSKIDCQTKKSEGNLNGSLTLHTMAHIIADDTICTSISAPESWFLAYLESKEISIPKATAHTKVSKSPKLNPSSFPPDKRAIPTKETQTIKRKVRGGPF